MKKFFNPHTFDMNNYYTGQTFMVGGKDFSDTEKELKREKLKSDKKAPIRPSWSFQITPKIPTKNS